VVLIGLPFAIAFVIFLLNPEYIKILTTDPTGKIVVISALILMAIGTLTMKKMIKIEV
jgi:tight adherence protein B